MAESPDPAQRICQLAEEAVGAGDPEAALRTLTELRRELDGFVRLQVGRALAANRSFADVARALGISRQAAHSRFRELAAKHRRGPRRPLVATDAARRAVRLARAEALATGTAPGSEHVLLGILHTDGDAAVALRSEGVTLETARACVRSADGEQPATEGSGGIRRMLRQAGRVALARGDSRLNLSELLLAALADPDGGARRVLTAHGVSVASVRARLGC